MSVLIADEHARIPVTGRSKHEAVVLGRFFAAGIGTFEALVRDLALLGVECDFDDQAIAHEARDLDDATGPVARCRGSFDVTACVQHEPFVPIVRAAWYLAGELVQDLSGERLGHGGQDVFADHWLLNRMLLTTWAMAASSHLDRMAAPFSRARRAISSPTAILVPFQ